MTRQAAKPTSSRIANAAGIKPAAIDVDADHYDDEHDADELWDVAASPRRRLRRKRGQDPLIIVMGVVAAMCAIGVVILALSLGAKDKTDEGEGDSEATASTDDGDPQAPPPRPAPSEQAINDVQIRIALVTDRLEDTDVPGPLQPEIDALLARVALAKVAIDDGRMTEGYDILREADRQAQALEDRVQQYDEHAEVLLLQAGALAARELALADEAPKWAPQVWAEAEQALSDGQAAIEQGDDFSAYDSMVQAQSDYEFAQSQASLGFLAIQAQSELDDEIGRRFNVTDLEAHGGEAWSEMLLLRTNGGKELESYDYGAALNSFETALRRLQQARSGVRLAQGVMFYAFAAGYQATDALIAIAAGDGLTVEKRGLIEDVFDDLRLETPLSRALPAGTQPDFAATADVLVNQAREAIASQHGVGAQISYRIGFQFRIIEQTLSNPVLSANHRSRISRALKELDELTAIANYAPDIRERFDAFRLAMRSTSSEEKLQSARDEWSDLIVLLRTYEQAMPIVNPSATEIEDPEMFPDH